jgi:WXG100 family type VII secretion target
MNDRISATEGALRRGAEAVSTTHLEISDSTRRVLAELENLQAFWVGDAARSYGAMMTSWSGGARRINDTLIHLEEALRSTERDQAAREEENRSTIGGLDAMMGGQ